MSPRELGLALLVLTELTVLTGCQMHSRDISFDVKFDLSDGKAIDNANLHVRGRRRCTRDEYKPDELAPDPPVPGLEDYDDEPMARVNIPLRTGKPEGEAWFKADRCEVALTAWYDTNGDRVVNAGDFVGSLPRREFRSLGTNLGKLVLKPVSL